MSGVFAIDYVTIPFGSNPIIIPILWSERPEYNLSSYSVQTGSNDAVSGKVHSSLKPGKIHNSIQIRFESLIELWCTSGKLFLSPETQITE